MWAPLRSRKCHKGGRWGYGFGLVGLHRKGKLKGELFAFSKNQLALGGAFPPELASPQDVKETKVQNKKTLLVHWANVFILYTGKMKSQRELVTELQVSLKVRIWIRLWSVVLWTTQQSHFFKNKPKGKSQWTLKSSRFQFHCLMFT